jgi:hypothetical protein
MAIPTIRRLEELVMRTLKLASTVLLVLLAAGCSSKAASVQTQPPSPAVVSSSSQGMGTSPSTATPPTAGQSAVVPQAAVPAEKNPPGDIPDNQAFVAYSAAGGFVVKTPEGWSRRSGANSVEFTDKLNTIQATWSPAASAPTVASVQAKDIPKLTASEPAFKLGSVRAVTLPAGPAVLVRYQANSAANPVTGKQYRLDVERYSVFRNGTRVDLTLLSPVGADNVDPWRIVTQSLSWK